MDLYVADFEATTEETFNREGLTRVWLSQARRIDSTFEITQQGNNLDDFMEWASKGSRPKKIYFHNLKYDGTFIIDFLLRHGVRHLEQGEKPKSNTFKTLITDNGVFFSTTYYKKVYKKTNMKIEFVDSLKKLPFSAEEIAKAFNLEVKKGSIDYDKFRPVGYEPTEEEIDYISNDTMIIAQALFKQFEQGMMKMTVASDAMFSFKNTIGDGKFKYLFPTLTYEADANVRLSYRGGWTYLKVGYSEVLLQNVVSYDVNSLFPSVMYNDLLPYGVPVYYTGEYKKSKTYPLFIQHISLNARIKKDHLPTFQAKNNFAFIPTDYITDTKGEMIDLWVTSIDLQLILDHYNIIDIEYHEGYKFKGGHGIFTEYIDYWYNIKNTSTGAMKTLAKLMLNSLYGKFAMNPLKIRKEPYLDIEADIVRYKTIIDEKGEPIYTAMASFITAYARNKTIRSAQKLYKRFVYADTDSLHLLGIETPDIDIDSKRLGAWKYEGLSLQAKFIRPKTYLKHHEGDEELEVKCAGMPDKVKKQVTFENFSKGAVYTGKLSSKKVKGGTILKSIDFKIKRG